VKIAYAVAWQESDGTRHSGRLDLGDVDFRLTGRNGGGPAEMAVPYTSIRNFQIVGSSVDRLQNRPTLLVELSDGRQLKIASVAQSGIAAEIAHHLGELTGRQNASEREALVVPLVPGSQAQAEALLADGPPFDPADFGLERHEVYVTDSEVVFVFEGAPRRFLERLAEAQTVWKAAEAWRPVIAGPIRLGLQAYAWPR
jgi:hypothetical protein